MKFKEKISKEQYFYLKTQAIAYSTAATATRQASKKFGGVTKIAVKNVKHELGQKARPHQIALAFLRGHKYSEVERNVREPISEKDLEDVLIWRLSYAYRTGDFKKDLEEFFQKDETEKAVA